MSRRSDSSRGAFNDSEVPPLPGRALRARMETGGQVALLTRLVLAPEPSLFTSNPTSCTLGQTDLSTYSACQHATLLERDVARGVLSRPHWNDPAKQLLAERGRQHENRYRALLEARYGEPVFRIPGAIPKTTRWWIRSLRSRRAARRSFSSWFGVPAGSIAAGTSCRSRCATC